MTTVILVVVIAAAFSSLVAYVLTTRRLETIHDLVNSNLTRVQSDLVVAQHRIEVLEEHLVELGRMSPTNTTT